MYKYQKIENKEDYYKLLNSGMFFEFYPELSGSYEKDIVIISESWANFVLE